MYIYISMSSRCGIPACGKDCFPPLLFRHLGSSWMETAPSQEYGISHHTVSDLHLDCTFQQWVLNLLGWSRALGDPKSVGVWSFFPEFISMFDGKAPKLLQNSGVFLLKFDDFQRRFPSSTSDVQSNSSRLCYKMVAQLRAFIYNYEGEMYRVSDTTTQAARECGLGSEDIIYGCVLR